MSDGRIVLVERFGNLHRRPCVGVWREPMRRVDVQYRVMTTTDEFLRLWVKTPGFHSWPHVRASEVLFVMERDEEEEEG